MSVQFLNPIHSVGYKDINGELSPFYIIYGDWFSKVNSIGGPNQLYLKLNAFDLSNIHVKN